jgi:hypothetical protein
VRLQEIFLCLENVSAVKCGAPRAKARGPSTSFVGRNPPKHTLLRSFGASKGTLPAFIHGLKTRDFLRRRVKKR